MSNIRLCVVSKACNKTKSVFFIYGVLYFLSILILRWSWFANTDFLQVIIFTGILSVGLAIDQVLTESFV